MNKYKYTGQCQRCCDNGLDKCAFLDKLNGVDEFGRCKKCNQEFAVKFILTGKLRCNR